MRDFHFPGRSPVFSSNGMCATSHPLAAQVAVDILARGGTAMDAAIAGAVLLGICEPHMCGIGGDCFVLHSGPGGADVRGYNGSGRAPAAASAAALRAQGHVTVPESAPAGVTIPGAVEAFCTLSDTHGRLGLDALLAPAIHYAEAGVPLAPRVASDWTRDADTLNAHAQTHFMPTGFAPVPGALFRAPGQAEVLRRIARDGARAFYEGEVADDICASLSALGGVHTGDDLATHRGEKTTPISQTYQGIELIEHPPNGQGATAILMLNILAQFDLAALDPLGATRAHIEAEATKLAYDARNRILADPDHTARLAHMIAPETAAKLAALIDLRSTIPDPAPLTESVHRDTVYITVVDKERRTVSLIYSLFNSFGSGIASGKFGILLQNRGTGFSLTEGHPNEMAGGKRPMHTIIPAMLAEGGKVVNSFGVMGGAYQPCGHARFVTNLRDFGMDPQTAIDAPRCFWEGGKLKVERGYPQATRQALGRLGHDIITPDGPIGGGQSITIRADGALEGASDPRKDGCALGY